MNEIAIGVLLIAASYIVLAVNLHCSDWTHHRAAMVRMYFGAGLFVVGVVVACLGTARVGR